MARDKGILQESGERWKLDLLIPDRDRLLVGCQIDRTSRQYLATKPVLCTDRHIDPSLRYYTPIYSRAESMLEFQRRMRIGDRPQPGDRIE